MSDIRRAGKARRDLEKFKQQVVDEISEGHLYLSPIELHERIADDYHKDCKYEKEFEELIYAIKYTKKLLVKYKHSLKKLGLTNASLESSQQL